MKNRYFGRKTTAMLCALAVSAGQLPAMAASASDFSDLPDNWSKPALEFAIANGLLQGYDGLLRPNDPMTRAEMATVLNQAFAAEAQAVISFADVPSTAWYYTQVAKAVQMQTFAGVSDTQFAPNLSITREQAFAAIARAFRLEDSGTAGLDKFSDKGEVSSWAQNSLSVLAGGGYVVGDNGKLRPRDTITRAEFCQVMYQLIARFVSQTGEVSELGEGNILVNEAGVTVKNAKITGDLIAGDGIMSGSFTVRDTTVGNRLLVRGGSTNTVYIYGTQAKNGIVVFNPNSTVLIGTDTRQTVKNDLEAQTPGILQGDFGTVTVAKNSKVTVKAGASVANWVFEDGATMENNVVFESTGGSTGGGGGGGGGGTVTTKYTWKIALDASVNNTSLTGGAKTLTGSAYTTSGTKLEDFVNTVTADSENAVQFAMQNLLEKAIAGSASTEPMLSEDGKLLPMTFNTEVEVPPETILNGDVASDVAAKVPAEAGATETDVVAVLNGIATPKGEQAAVVANADAEKWLAIMDTLTSEYKDVFETDGDGMLIAVNIEKAKVDKIIEEFGIQGISITDDNFDDLKATYVAQYNNLLALLRAKNSTSPRAALLRAADDETVTMHVPVSVNIGAVLWANESALWAQMDEIFVKNDPEVAALKAAAPVSDFLVKDGEDYYLKADAGQGGAYQGSSFTADCAAYLTEKMIEIAPLMYAVAAKGEVDPSNQTYPESRLQEMFVNRMKLDIKQAYKSDSDGTDQNTKVTADYAAFVKAFREKKGDMTLKEAIDLLGADCFEVDKTFKGANMERFVRTILDGMSSIPDTVDKETLIRQIMNRLERYNLIVDATLDWNTAIPTQQ